MGTYKIDQIVKALKKFFKEEEKMAIDAGYDFLVVKSKSGKRFYVDIIVKDELLPKIAVDPQENGKGVGTLKSQQNLLK